MLTDVKSAYLAASGNFQTDGGSPINITRTRVRGLFVSGTGTVVLKDGGVSGITRITINAASQGNVQIPGDGVLFLTDVYGVLGGTATCTIFYG